jgi:hypothetical protein
LAQKNTEEQGKARPTRESFRVFGQFLLGYLVYLNPLRNYGRPFWHFNELIMSKHCLKVFHYSIPHILRRWSFLKRIVEHDPADGAIKLVVDPSILSPWTPYLNRFVVSATSASFHCGVRLSLRA